MRKTLFAMLGLAAVALWVLPAVAGQVPGGLVVDGPKLRVDQIPLADRPGSIGAMARGERYQGTLSGTLIKQQTVATTSWYLYPGACVERALGTWAGKSTPVADSLQPTTGFPNSSGYTDNQPDIAGGNNTIAYTRADLSIPDRLWHVVNSGTPSTQRPAIINGSNSIWCGTYDPGYLASHHYGYPNLTFQILYIDTGTHAGAYNLTFTGEISAELNYDAVTLLGGGSDGGIQPSDPLENRRDLMSDICFGPAAIGQNGLGVTPNQELACWTGAIRTNQSVTANQTGDFVTVEGDAAQFPLTVTYAVNNIPAVYRGLYFVFQSDCLYSTEDGNWPNSRGQVLDLISVSDNGSIYNDQAENGAFDHLVPAGSGVIIKGTEGSFGAVIARVPPGIGELWQLAPGTENHTSDNCALQKASGSDLFFEGGDPTSNLSIDKQFNAVVSCTFRIPAGTGSVFALWDSYFDMPRFSGLVQDTEYRIYKNGVWGNWQDSDGAEQVSNGALEAWFQDGNELASATQADSVQVRYDIRCIPPFAADLQHCSSSQSNALLYDNLRLQVTTGVPAPLFGIFPGDVAQSMFVDGFITGTNCGATPCYPGIRGSDQDQSAPDAFGFEGSLHNIAVNDNWNAASGDSIQVTLQTGLRKNGMGINWRRGFSKILNAGEPGPLNLVTHPELLGPAPFACSNGSYNAAKDFPRMIFRLYDPATNNWSPWDSTELIANNVQVSAETTLVEEAFQINWPPYDKVIANASIPNQVGFANSINGVSAYRNLDFLPRGARMQYYFKAVDIAGTGNQGVSYQFSTDVLAREVEDLPTLPGSSIIAPDIIEFNVLPRKYPAGPGGSLLAGRTDTPVLNLDGVYGTWAFGYDPVTQALRALGVRADRYRFLPSGTTANHFGGHELPGKRPDRLSNFIPNYLEYPIIDSLATWYRIILESSHTRTATVFNEQDATLANQWWKKDTGSNQGDRCIFYTGDDAFNNLINTTGVDITLEVNLASETFGVQSVNNAWSGTTTNAYPTIDDRFAGGSAAALAAAGTFTYPIDGGCPGPNKFDALVPVVAGDNAASAFYTQNNVVAGTAGVARSREMDSIGDSDRNKALSYGFSFQFIRDPAYGVENANYTRSGVENRMRVLYKFLTGCRGAHVGSACWPCPIPTPQTVSEMQSEWSADAVGFNTATYGPLYPIQAGALATAVDLGNGGEAAPRINKIEGNFPNPFNPHTLIRFTSAQAGKAEIRIFGVSGQLVRKISANVTVGANEVRWNGKREDGSPLASGVYFYKIVFPNGESFRAPNNLVLVK